MDTTTTTTSRQPTTDTDHTARLARRSSLIACLIVAAVSISACGGGEIESSAAPEPPAPAPTRPVEGDSVAEHATDELDDDEPEPQDDDPAEEDIAPAVVARATDHLDVHDAPGSDTVTHTLEATTSFGTDTVLLVHEVDGDWLEVLLPVRPNGTTGWIHAEDVEVSEVELHVKVDLDARELTVVDAGEEVLTTQVAIGDADHPTPTGSFFVTDKLDTGDPDGPYGPYAIGLSARSDVLTEFAGGDGQVGIHGTNVPSSIGQAASHGCIRVDNEVIEQLAHLLPLGTPVTVS
jgi:lipoprotein-anchoring transpeptidase ErfK/SrfK